LQNANFTDVDSINDMTKASRTDLPIDPKRLWRRYAFAIVALFVLMLVSHMSARQAAIIAKADATIVNDAGRQRMLSQQILYLTSQNIHGDVSDRGNQRLQQSIGALESRHQALSAMAQDNDLLRHAYFGETDGPSLDTLVEQFLRDARIASIGEEAVARRAFDRMRQISQRDLLDLLDKAVARHEMAAAYQANRLALIRNAALVAALLTLILEVLLVLRPANLVTRNTLTALHRKTGALETAQNEVKQRTRQLAAMCDVVKHDAMHDALTGLANRRHLRRELAERCENIDESESGLALFQIDLDSFKDINDTLGHEAGDHVLVNVATVLRQCLRDNDFIARTGGDEFVIVTGDCADHETLDTIAGRLIEALAKPVDYNGALCSPSVSIGIETYLKALEGRPLDVDTILSNADIALYRAKEKGRNRSEFFNEAMRVEVEESRSLGDDIIRAIERDEFFPVYQVQVAAGGRGVHGVEALARWQHPEKGEIAPWRFLPVAARLGITDDIDDAILRHSLNDVAAWRAAGLDVPNLSVNVSARRLADPDLIPRLRDMAIPPGTVSFEVLESVFADRMDDALRFTLDSLDEMGIAIEVDDFGTGHASLLALLSLRPDRLKIARELIDPAPTSSEHRAVLESIMQIARALDTEVVAEGIETEEHAVLSEDIGVDILQGFHFCRPLRENEAAERIVAIAQAAGQTRAA